MIIWLASYPRSGNTLLRTIIHQCFGLPGYADEQGPEKHMQSPEAIRAREIVGGRRHPGTWEEFYKLATDSDELFLVKTHRKPVDEQAAIHIVRDGRKASHSYFHFLRSYFPEAEKSLLAILSGDDAYGHWSSHYADWLAHRGRRLELRYEDLVHPSPDTLREIAAFIDCKQPVAGGWMNPFEQLHGQAPEFFREGTVGWTTPDDWSPHHDSVFWELHGTLMQRLGYDKESR